MKTTKKQFKDIGRVATTRPNSMKARAGGWLVGAHTMARVAMLLLLALSLVPQYAAAGGLDYEPWFAGKNVTDGDDGGGHYYIFTTCYYHTYGNSESWNTDDGLVVKVSKDGGSNYQWIFRVKCKREKNDDNPQIEYENYWNGAQGNGAAVPCQ